MTSSGESPGRSEDGILAGSNVVECGQGIAAAFAAKMMVDLGAYAGRETSRRGRAPAVSQSSELPPLKAFGDQPEY